MPTNSCDSLQTAHAPVTDEAVEPVGDRFAAGVQCEPAATVSFCGKPAWVGWAALLGTALVAFSHRPLWHTDLWGHLAYGRFIWNTGALPRFEPLIPSASDVPIVDTAWLSQLMGFAIHAALGVPGIQTLYGLLVTGCFALTMLMIHWQTRSACWSLLGGGLFLWVDWQQLAIVRPQLAGLFWFVCLLAVLTAPRRGKFDRIIVAAIFAVWANCHGSFIIGIATLFAFLAGRVFDIVWRARRFDAVLGDERLRSLLVLTALATVASAINPYGIAIYGEVVSFSAKPNLSELVEWQPLSLRTYQGQAALAVSVALIPMWYLTPRRVKAVEILLIAGLGAGAVWASRMIVWWAPVAAYLAAYHGHAIQTRRLGERALRANWVQGRAWSFAAVAVCCSALAVTPIVVGSVLGNSGLSSQTPVGAVAHLEQTSITGRMFNKFEWGDYLIWSRPTSAQVFVASHAHLIPESIWQDYLRIAEGRMSWKNALDIYDIDSVMIHPTGQSYLARKLRGSSDWSIDYEDEWSVIFVRSNKKPAADVPGG